MKTKQGSSRFCCSGNFNAHGMLGIFFKAIIYNQNSKYNIFRISKIDHFLGVFSVCCPFKLFRVSLFFLFFYYWFVSVNVNQ